MATSILTLRLFMLIKMILLLTLLIGLVSCSPSEPELYAERFDDNAFKEFANNGTLIENKYFIDKNIYLYIAYDRRSLIDDYPSYAGCAFRVYNFEKSAHFTSVDDALSYLNHVDTREQPKWAKSLDGNNKYDISSKQLIDSIWFKQSNLPNDFFNPLNVDLTKFYANNREKITESPVKTIYNECLQFFFDGAEKQTYTQEKGLTFLEKYREGFEKQYSKSTFDKVLVDGNSLVRFNSYCDGALFEFFNIEHRLLITLDIGVGKKFPNPDCKYEFKS